MPTVQTASSQSESETRYTSLLFPYYYIHHPSHFRKRKKDRRRIVQIEQQQQQQEQPYPYSKTLPIIVPRNSIHESTDTGLSTSTTTPAAPTALEQRRKKALYPHTTIRAKTKRRNAPRPYFSPPLLKKPAPAVPGPQPVSAHAVHYRQAARNPGSNSEAYPSAGASGRPCRARPD